MIQSTTTLAKVCKLVKENKKDPAPTFVICGGASCSKTFSILMILINRALQWDPNKKLPNGDQDRGRYFIASSELSKMKHGLIPDFEFIMKEFDLFEPERFKGGTEYQFPTGAIIKFIGLDKADIGKGLRTSILFVNEANKVKFETYLQMASRAGVVFIDYNPDYESWIERKLLGVEDDHVHFLRVTFRDNEQCPIKEVEQLLGYKQKGYNEDGTIKNEYYANLWNVFGEGLPGRAIGAVFTNWKIGDFVDNGITCYGLDFGFSNDPDALVLLSVDEKTKTIYIKEELYKNGNSSDELYSLLKNKCGNKLIVADCAEDRLINDFKLKRLNIRACKKNRVIDDIKVLQGYTLVVDENSINLQEELNKYIWLDSEYKTVPIDKYNHLIDCSRYAFNALKTPQRRDSVINIY